MATLYGDMETADPLNVRAQAQTLIGTDNEDNFLCGDAFIIAYGKGGNDVLIGGSGEKSNYVFGDAVFMFASRGGNDVLTGGSGAMNSFYGDARAMADGSWGGNDVLVGGGWRSQFSLW